MGRIHIRFSFLVFNALIFLLRDGGLILMFYTVCAVHELGHLAAIQLTGGKVRSMTLTGAGIIISQERKTIRSDFSGVIVLLAGPAANLTMFAVMTILHCRGDFPLLNLAAAVYNLLPYYQLDGGAIIGLLASGTTHETAICRAVTAIQVVMAALLMILAVIFGGALAVLFIVSIGLTIAGMLEYSSSTPHKHILR